MYACIRGARAGSAAAPRPFRTALTNAWSAEIGPVPGPGRRRLVSVSVAVDRPLVGAVLELDGALPGPRNRRGQYARRAGEEEAHHQRQPGHQQTDPGRAA